ncbi:MAG: hypothetical protein ABSF54_09115 [Bryobacteraceae bacterium]|jgi:hypothetical protein
MQEPAFWKAVIVDESNFLEAILAMLAENHIRYCVIGGQGVNAYVDPLVGLELDLVVAAEQINGAKELLRSIDLTANRSKLRVQIQTDPRYFSFLERARPAAVLGLDLPVANIEDILQGKIWAAQDLTRRPSKRRKDLLDIERIVDAYPALRAQVPQDILDRLQAP